MILMFIKMNTDQLVVVDAGEIITDDVKWKPQLLSLSLSLSLSLFLLWPFLEFCLLHRWRGVRSIIDTRRRSGVGGNIFGRMQVTSEMDVSEQFSSAAHDWLAGAAATLLLILAGHYGPVKE